MIIQASYNRKQQVLHITVNDKTYVHYNVPMYVFNNLAESHSREEFYEENIKNVYPVEKQNNV